MPGSCTLVKQDLLICRDVPPMVHSPARPSHCEFIHLIAGTQTEMDAEIVLRKIATSAANFVHLRQISALRSHHRADAVLIRL